MSAPLPGKLPEWPQKPLFDESCGSTEWEIYYEATSAYWAERCRLAVRGLDALTHPGSTEYGAAKTATNILKAIGPLPEEDRT